MKIRNGFVSNSSSCSFTIKLEHFNSSQLYQILHISHTIQAFRLSGIDLDELGCTEIEYIVDWTIHKKEDVLEFNTILDNFNMIEFLNKIGITQDKIENL